MELVSARGTIDRTYLITLRRLNTKLPPNFRIFTKTVRRFPIKAHGANKMCVSNNNLKHTVCKCLPETHP